MLVVSDKVSIKVAIDAAMEIKDVHDLEVGVMPDEKIDEIVMEKVHPLVSEIATVVVKVNREKMLGSMGAVKKVH